MVLLILSVVILNVIMLLVNSCKMFMFPCIYTYACTVVVFVLRPIFSSCSVCLCDCDSDMTADTIGTYKVGPSPSELAALFEFTLKPRGAILMAAGPWQGPEPKAPAVYQFAIIAPDRFSLTITSLDKDKDEVYLYIIWHFLLSAVGVLLTRLPIFTLLFVYDTDRCLCCNSCSSARWKNFLPEIWHDGMLLPRVVSFLWLCAYSFCRMLSTLIYSQLFLGAFMLSM